MLARHEGFGPLIDLILTQLGRVVLVVYFS